MAVAVGFGVASTFAGKSWGELVTEQATAAYWIKIPLGMPIVTLAGGLGVGVAVLLAGLILWRRTE